MSARLKNAGVDFTQEIVEQPYGRDFAIRGRCGNNIRIGDAHSDLV